MKDARPSGAVVPLSGKEQEHGLRIMEQLVKLQQDLRQRQDAAFTPASWELLNTMRDERTHDLPS